MPAIMPRFPVPGATTIPSTTRFVAGEGVKRGTVYGAIDSFGYHAVEGKMELNDLHATVRHPLGLDHERSTFRFGGRDLRLTEVHGHVVCEIIA